ncbi:ATP-binding cassette domain-containing protein (plasmid) [Haloferacaceae archaeon DSL9]
MPNDDILVSMNNISKRYGEVVALEDVDLHIRRGEVLGLAGDNGAGKSTLIKCLSGAIVPDKGSVAIDGNEVKVSNPRVAQKHGIETTFQDLALAENLTVTRNVFLGRELTIGAGLVGLLKKKEMRSRSEELLDRLGIDVDPDAVVGDLSGGEQQLVAISRNLLSDPELVIMDEPTSALSVEGAERVLDFIEELQSQGITILLISHNIEYMKQVTDRVKILYNGQDAGVLDTEDVTREKVVSRMISGAPEAQDETSAVSDPVSG